MKDNDNQSGGMNSTPSSAKETSPKGGLLLRLDEFFSGTVTGTENLTWGLLFLLVGGLYAVIRLCIALFKLF